MASCVQFRQPAGWHASWELTCSRYSGTGPQGRIQSADVRAFAAQRDQVAAAAPAAPLPAQPSSDTAAKRSRLPALLARRPSAA